MKKVIKLRIISLLICFVTLSALFGGTITNVSFALNAGDDLGLEVSDTQDETVNETTQDQSGNSQSESDNANDESDGTTSDVSDGLSIELDGSNESSQKSLSTTTDSNEVAASPQDSKINYFAVEKPYITNLEVQNFVLSWGDGSSVVEEAQITYITPSGQEVVVMGTQEEDSLILFSQEISSQAQSGTYTVKSLMVKENGVNLIFDFATMGMDLKFGVNVEYEGYDDGTTIDGDEDIEASIVDLDGKSTSEATNEITQGISEATSITSNELTSRAMTVSQTEELVVVLDPGHGVQPGAVYGSLVEAELVWKIANYAKAELEQYAGVKVLLTRSGSRVNHSSSDAIQDIKNRVAWAKTQGADVFVSLHLNATGTGSASGAEVYYPNSSWISSSEFNEGKNLATAIQAQLVSIGLRDRGIKIRNTSIGEEYPDGSTADYYTVILQSKYAGFPGLIVEHAFMDNSSDASKYLSTEAGLKSLGVADATGIAKAYGLSKGGWETVNGQLKYKINGSYIVNQWYKIGDYTYKFDENGYALTGWQDIDGERYYFMPDGKMHTGWLVTGGKTYYMMSDGHMHTGWLTLTAGGAGPYYYFYSNGIRQNTGWMTLGGEQYYFIGDDAHMHTGWLIIGNETYYLLGDGRMHTGWLTLTSGGAGPYYYLKEDGTKQGYGWATIDGEKYFFIGSDNHRHTGWLTTDGVNFYYLDSNGVTLRNTQQEIDGITYIFDENGVSREANQLNGWDEVAGKYYYYINGAKATGWQTISGNTYYFIGSDAYRYSGWLTLSSGGTGPYYYLNEHGIKQGEGWATIDGNKYYFISSDAYRHTGWLSFGSTRYYLDSNGVTLRNTQRVINGVNYSFDENGVSSVAGVKNGWEEVSGKYYYYINGAKATGWQTISGNTYYFLGSDAYRYSGWLTLSSGGKGPYYYLNEHGIKQGEGWATIDGNKYYFISSDAYRHTGWLSFGSTRYYLDSNGVTLRNTQRVINGVNYAFDENGVAVEADLKNGWIEESGKTYYYVNGVKATGWQTINGSNYYFIGSDAYRYSGWLTLSSGGTGPYYYLNEYGIKQSEGWATIDGNKYYFISSDAYRHTGWLSFGSTRYYLDSNGVTLVNTERVIDGVSYTFDENGVSQETLTRIMGESIATVNQMVTMFNASGRAYPSAALSVGGAPTIEAFATIVLEEANAEGVRAEVVFAQVMKETGYLQFGGDVKIEQFNFAGLGATGGVPGNSFVNVRTGIRAQVQHLKCYASTEPLNNENVDPRWWEFLRGKAVYVEHLGIKENPNGYGWASQEYYGYSLVNDYMSKILNVN